MHTQVTESSPAAMHSALRDTQLPYDALIAEDENKRISGLSRSERWRRIQDSLYPPPINCGTSRCTRWSLHETLQWQQAIKAGKTKEEIRELVKSLVAARKTGHPEGA